MSSTVHSSDKYVFKELYMYLHDIDVVVRLSETGMI